MSVSSDDLRRLQQVKQTKHRPHVDDEVPEAKAQRNKLFRMQAFFALRRGFERGRLREKQEATRREAQEKLKAAMEQLAANGQDPNIAVITPPTIARVERAAVEAASGKPAA